MKLRDILMYITAFSGILLIAYVRISCSTRQQKSPAKALDYTDLERKLRKLGIVLTVIGLLLAFIPAKYAF